MDFTIADMCGRRAIHDTFKRAFEEWKDNYEYLTELVMVLNWKVWLCIRSTKRLRNYIQISGKQPIGMRLTI